MTDINEIVDSLIHALGIKMNAFLAGIFGGIASISGDQKISVRRSLALVFTGAFTAGYLTPMVESYFKLDTQMAGGMAFVFGLLGMRLTGGIIKLGDQFNYNPISFVLTIIDSFKTFIKSKLS